MYGRNCVVCYAQDKISTSVDKVVTTFRLTVKQSQQRLIQLCAYPNGQAAYPNGQAAYMPGNWALADSMPDEERMLAMRQLPYHKKLSTTCGRYTHAMTMRLQSTTLLTTGLCGSVREALQMFSSQNKKNSYDFNNAIPIWVSSLGNQEYRG